MSRPYIFMYDDLLFFSEYGRKKFFFPSIDEKGGGRRVVGVVVETAFAWGTRRVGETARHNVVEPINYYSRGNPAIITHVPGTAVSKGRDVSALTTIESLSRNHILRYILYTYNAMHTGARRGGLGRVRSPVFCTVAREHWTRRTARRAGVIYHARNGSVRGRAAAAVKSGSRQERTAPAREPTGRRNVILRVPFFAFYRHFVSYKTWSKPLTNDTLRDRVWPNSRYRPDRRILTVPTIVLRSFML